MTAEEAYSYIRLLMYQWKDPTGTLPDDDISLAAFSGAGERWLNGSSNGSSNFRSSVVRIWFEKHPELPGRIANKRLYSDWKKAQAWSEKCRSAGVRSGRKRKCKNEPDVSADQPGDDGVLNSNIELGLNGSSIEKKGGIYSSSILKTKTTSKALLTREDLDVGSTESCSNNPVPESENISELLSPAEEFGLTPDQPKPERLSQADWAERIYQAYPRKVAKQAALKAIRKALKAEGPESLLDAVQAYAEATSRWDSDQRKFIPHPASWFNAGHYADDRADWDRKSESEPRSIWDNIPPLTPEIDEMIEAAGRLVRGDV